MHPLARVLSCLLVLGLASASAHAQTLVHYYDFSTGTVNDQVGDANGVLTGDASITGGELVTGGDSDSGLLLNGSGVATSAVSGITGSFSIEDWVTLTDDSQFFPLIFGFGSSTSADYLLSHPYRASYGGDATVEYNSDATGSNGIDLESDGSSLPVGTQQLVGLTYDASTETFTVYLNGVEAGSANTGGALDLSTIAGTSDGGIGGFDAFGDPTAIADTSKFAIYTGALTADQMMADFTAGAAGAGGESLGVGSAPEPRSWAMACLVLVAFCVARRRVGFIS